MEGFNIASLFFIGIVIVLIILFVVSFTLFIRRIIINTSSKSTQTNEIEKKIDKIIDLLEKNNNV
jgi:biopolymer transport protein ExbD